MITYEEYIKLESDYSNKLDEASAVLNSFPKGEIGLTPDHIKFSPEFKEAKQAFNYYFNALRELNKANKAYVKLKGIELRNKRINRLSNP